MKNTIASSTARIAAATFLWSCFFFPLTSAVAQAPEKLYADLAKLKPEDRVKKLEEGVRKEGKLNFVHTWRGKLARDNTAVFAKRYPYI